MRPTCSPHDLWLALDALEALPQGTVRHYSACGHSLVVWRGAGAPVVMDNACPHRGARLSDGRVVEGTIACPYHGLRFDAVGRCTVAPSEDRVPSIRARVRQSRQWAGLLLVRLEDKGEDRFPPADPPAFVGSRTTLCGPYRWRAAPLDVIENFIDVAHLPFVHAGVLGDPAHARVATFAVENVDGRPESNEVEVYQPRPSGDRAPNHSRYAYRLLTPLAAEFRKEFGGEQYRAVLLVTPTTPDECLVWLVVAHDAAHTSEAIRTFQASIMEQDRAMLEAMAELRGGGARKLHALKSDALIVAYRKWLKATGFTLEEA